MPITEMEDRLFDEWSKTVPGLVKDGAADEQAFSSSAIKVAFLLKEVNDPDGGGWDLREYLRRGGRAETWNNVTRWVQGIRNLERDLVWSDIADVSEDQRISTLRSIVAVNLKKRSGSHTTEESSFWEAAKRDSIRLRQQIGLYEADLLICCGCGRYLPSGLPANRRIQWTPKQRRCPIHRVIRRH